MTEDASGELGRVARNPPVRLRPYVPCAAGYFCLCLSQRSRGYRSTGILPVGPPDILSRVSYAAGELPLAEDSAGETPAVPTDKISGLLLQLRAEGVSQPFHCSLLERATPELLKGVLVALAEIAGKGFLHVSPKSRSYTITSSSSLISAERASRFDDPIIENCVSATMDLIWIIVGSYSKIFTPPSSNFPYADYGRHNDRL